MLIAFLLVFLIIFTPILVSAHYRNVIPKYFNYMSTLYHDFGVVKKSAVYKHPKLGYATRHRCCSQYTIGGHPPGLAV